MLLTHENVSLLHGDIIAVQLHGDIFAVHSHPSYWKLTVALVSC